MKNGLYEVPVFTKITDEKSIKKELIEKAEMPKILSKDYEVLLRRKLEGLHKDEVFSFYQDLYKLIDENEATNPELLLVVHNDENNVRELSDRRPLTSIAFSSFFTGKRWVIVAATGTGKIMYQHLTVKVSEQWNQTIVYST